MRLKLVREKCAGARDFDPDAKKMLVLEDIFSILYGAHCLSIGAGQRSALSSTPFDATK